MSKLVVTEYITVDGVVENPVWIGSYWNEESSKYKFDELFGGDTLLMGRVTYEYFAPVWIGATAADDEPGQEGFADRINSLPKYIVSTTLESSEWVNSHLIKDDVVAEITRLRDQPGGDILVAGSGELVQFLMQHDLVDEYRFLVFPLILGSGKRLFGHESKANLQLVESQTFSTGVLALTYRPDRGAEATS